MLVVLYLSSFLSYICWYNKWFMCFNLKKSKATVMENEHLILCASMHVLIVSDINTAALRITFSLEVLLVIKLICFRARCSHFSIHGSQTLYDHYERKITSILNSDNLNKAILVLLVRLGQAESIWSPFHLFCWWQQWTVYLIHFQSCTDVASVLMYKCNFLEKMVHLDSPPQRIKKRIL